MEGGSVAAYKAISSYWRQRGYERLAPTGPDPYRSTQGPRDLGKTRRRIWRPRVRVAPKVKILRFMASSPKKVLLWLRDGYVRMMLGFANSRLFAAGGTGYYSGGASNYFSQTGYAFGKAPLKEYDRKVIVEIYRSVVAAQGKLATKVSLGGGGQLQRQQVVCSR